VARVVLFHHRPDRTDDQLDELARRYAAQAQATLAAETLVLDI
jgi:phosphoribosyl 1,2-cyclic phosphodiesterase